MLVNLSVLLYFICTILLHVFHNRLFLGGAALGGFFGRISDEAGIQLVEYAIKHGINFIDTAPWYGHGKSEAVLGKVYKVYVTCSKCYYMLEFDVAYIIVELQSCARIYCCKNLINAFISKLLT